MKAKLLDDVKKLYGLPPYNDFSNICYGDSYFAADINRRYGADAVREALKELGISTNEPEKEAEKNKPPITFEGKKSPDNCKTESKPYISRILLHL